MSDYLQSDLLQSEEYDAPIFDINVLHKSSNQHEDNDANNQINKLPEQQIENIELNTIQTKRKAINKKQKEPQKKKKQPKRFKGQQYKTLNYRPINTEIQRQHLRQNKGYNDIIYHYSRILIFIKLRQEEDFIPYAMHFTNQQSLWVSQTTQIMSQDNFPSFEDHRPKFLLHPASMHFVFKYRKQNQHKDRYSPEQIKFIMFAFLLKKGLFNESIYSYINQFWNDIIYLVHHPGNEQKMEEKQPIDQFLQEEEEDMPQNSPEDNRNQGQQKTGKKKPKTTLSEIQLMKKQLKDDSTIIAYEMACYLHSCCQKFSIRILPE